MNPYRNIPGAEALKRLPLLLRKRTLLAFGLGLTAGVGLGPVAAVLALRSAPPSVPVAAPSPIADAPEQIAPDAPDPPAEQVASPPPERSRMSPAQAKATIARQADRVMKALTNRDTKALAGMIDEDKGLVLNPFSEGGDFPPLEVEEVRGCFQDHRARVWGDRSGDGTTVTFTCAEYWKRYIGFVYLGAPSDVTYNEVHASELDQDPQLGVDVDDISVRYAFLDDGGSSATQFVTLVFTPSGRAWKLSEIAHQGQAFGEPCGG